jgi:hypothetical protein
MIVFYMSFLIQVASSKAHSWLHPFPFVLTIMMPHVPLHPHGIPLQEFNEQMMMDKGTCWANISDSLASFCWFVKHKPGWLPAHAQNKMLLLDMVGAAPGIGQREEKN